MAAVSERVAILEINSEGVYATKVAVTASDANVDLTAIQLPLAPSGQKIAAQNGITQCMLVLQSDVDFFYCFNQAAATVVTDYTGSNVGVLVKAGIPELVRPASQVGRKFLHVLRSGTTSGTVAVFVKRTSGN